MKTPIQELIDKLEYLQRTNPNKLFIEQGIHHGLEAAIKEAKSMLEKEKEQMCDFVEYCEIEHSKYQETEASWIKELTIDDLFEKRYTK